MITGNLSSISPGVTATEHHLLCTDLTPWHLHMSALSVPSCLPDCLHSPHTPPPPPPSPPPAWAWTHWRWRLPQYVPTNYVYSRLQASDMHTGRRTWTNLRELGTGNWETLGMGMGMGSIWFWFCAPGCPSASTSASSTHRQRFGILAFWVGDAVPTSFPLRWGYDSDSDSICISN